MITQIIYQEKKKNNNNKNKKKSWKNKKKKIEYNHKKNSFWQVKNATILERGYSDKTREKEGGYKQLNVYKMQC